MESRPSPALGRFIQADTLVPQPGNPLAWDRYAYAGNNPVRYTDPSGHAFRADDGGGGELTEYITPIVISTADIKGSNGYPDSPVIKTPVPPLPELFSPYHPFTPTPTLGSRCTPGQPCIFEWKKPKWWDTDPQHPDYYALAINLGEVAGFTFVGIADRYGRVYIGGGGNIGKSISPISGSFNGGWVGSMADDFIPSPEYLETYLSGVSINGQIGAAGDFAIGMDPFDNNPFQDLSVEYGIVIPFSIGVSVTVNIQFP